MEEKEGAVFFSMQHNFSDSNNKNEAVGKNTGRK